MAVHPEALRNMPDFYLGQDPNLEVVGQNRLSS